MGSALQGQGFGFKVGGAAFTAPYKPTALHYAACAVQVALHSLRQCQWHSVTYTAVRLTATQLKPLLVRLDVHLDCDQCGRLPLAARVLQFRSATVCLRYNSRPNE